MRKGKKTKRLGPPKNDELALPMHMDGHDNHAQHLGIQKLEL
jgi:hypothetical protein